MEKLETLWNGITMATGNAFPLSTDSILLADFTPLGKNCKVADLGSGCGALGLLLCGKDESCRVTGIELQEASHNAALENIRRNHLSHRLSSMPGDIRSIRSLLPANEFDCVISNPPYFPQNAGAPAKGGARVARGEENCDLPSLFAAGAWLLHYGGIFCLVHRPERLTDLLFYARQCKLEPKRIRFVHHHATSPISLVLLQCKLGGKPGLTFEPDLILWEKDGSPTKEQLQIYRR